MLSKEIQEAVKELIAHYANPHGALLPVLQLVQQESGELDRQVLLAISEMLDIPAARVKGVASFYTSFENKQSGKHVIKVCTNLSCMVSGSDEIVNFLKEQYGLVSGSLTEDRRFTLVTTECLGACCGAPAMLVDNNLYENLTKDRIVDILKGYR
jgi:NADH:ubiquinone oxidoreductase subunit E